MAEKGVRVVAVTEGDGYLGLVSAEDLAEAMAVATFVERHRALRAAAAA
jgi:CBS domain-containing protein